MHHAYYIEDSTALFETYKKKISHFVAQKYERFGVDEARWLYQIASLKNISVDSVFLIALNSITIEAQQALLKLFEEPQDGTIFILLLPHGTLIPTLRSRMLPYPELSPDSKDSPWQEVEARRFLKMASIERNDSIAKLLKDNEGWPKERVRDFVNALEVEMSRSNLAKNRPTRQSLEDIAMVRGYLGDRAPSLKMLLEHLALILPNQDRPGN